MKKNENKTHNTNLKPNYHAKYAGRKDNTDNELKSHNVHHRTRGIELGTC